MKNKELFTLQKGIQAAGDLKGVKLAYALTVNLKRIVEAVTDLQESIKPTEALTEYETARVELCIQFASKDDEGSPVVVDGSYVLADVEAFDKAITALQEKYATAIEEGAKAREEYKDLLEDEATVNLIKVDLKYFPEDITAAQMSNLVEMINDEA